MDAKILIIITTAVLIMAANFCFADVKPNSLFSDNVVLQRDMQVPVWGTADNGERVKVSIAGQSASAVARDGKWMVRLAPMKAGGPYTMTITGKNTIEIKNVLIGEVWVCSGQSNMEWPMCWSEGGEEVMATYTNPMIHITETPRIPSEVPLADAGVSWKEISTESLRWYSAIGFFFGRYLNNNLNVPIGLLDLSLGGTRIEAWTPKVKLPVDLQQPDAYWKTVNQAGVLYNAHIAPIIPFAIRGVIWYQGESNAEKEAYRYRQLLPNMIESWRADWNKGDFPFLFVQIAPFGDLVDQPGDSPWAEIREGQLLTSKSCKNTAMTVITDAGHPKQIHPSQKDIVAQRLSMAARALAYGENVIYQGPTFRAIDIKGNRAVLQFDNTGSGLMAKNGDLTGFAICGDDHKYVNATATIYADKVIVYSPLVPNPKAVRYGWAECPIVNLYNKEGFPSSPFRTDSFPLSSEPK